MPSAPTTVRPLEREGSDTIETGNACKSATPPRSNTTSTSSSRS